MGITKWMIPFLLWSRFLLHLRIRIRIQQTDAAKKSSFFITGPLEYLFRGFRSLSRNRVKTFPVETLDPKRLRKFINLVLLALFTFFCLYIVRERDMNFENSSLRIEMQLTLRVKFLQTSNHIGKTELYSRQPISSSGSKISNQYEKYISKTKD